MGRPGDVWSASVRGGVGCGLWLAAPGAKSDAIGGARDAHGVRCDGSGDPVLDEVTGLVGRRRIRDGSRSRRILMAGRADAVGLGVGVVGGIVGAERPGLPGRAEAVALNGARAPGLWPVSCGAGASLVGRRRSRPR